MSDKKLNTELNGIAPSLHTPFNNDKTIDGTLLCHPKTKFKPKKTKVV